MLGSGLSAGAVPVPLGERMAAACRCSAVLPGSRSGGAPRGVFLSDLSASTAKPPLERKKYVRYRLPSVPTSALARRGGAVFSQGSLPRTAAAPRAAHGSEEHRAPLLPFPAAAATRGPPAPFHRAAPSGRPAQRCRRPTALLPDSPAAPTLRPRINIPAVIFKGFWEPFAL